MARSCWCVTETHCLSALLLHCLCVSALPLALPLCFGSALGTAFRLCLSLRFPFLPLSFCQRPTPRSRGAAAGPPSTHSPRSKHRLRSNTMALITSSLAPLPVAPQVDAAAELGATRVGGGYASDITRTWSVRRDRAPPCERQRRRRKVSPHTHAQIHDMQQQHRHTQQHSAHTSPNTAHTHCPIQRKHIARYSANPSPNTAGGGVSPGTPLASCRGYCRLMRYRGSFQGRAPAPSPRPSGRSTTW